MELIRYAQIVRRWWYLALVALVATVVTSLVLVNDAPVTYSTEGTFVVRPRATTSEDTVRAFDTLVRGVEINATYAEIAQSELVRDRARAHLDAADAEVPMSVDASIVTGTNLLQLTVTGPDPEAVHAYAVAMVDEITSYIDALADAYVLAPLDSPDLPGSPESSGRTLKLALGVVLGVALAVGLALLAEYIRRGLEARRASAEPLVVVDETAFRRTLRFSMGRVERSDQRLALVALRAPDDDADDADDVVSLTDALRDELVAHLAASVHVARLDDGTLVAAIEEPGIAELHRRLARRWGDAAAPSDGRGWPSVEVCVHDRLGTHGDEEAQRLLEELTGTPPTVEPIDRVLVASPLRPRGRR
jgi:capsular polysaccharide biosynthesis protein